MPQPEHIRAVSPRRDGNSTIHCTFRVTSAEVWDSTWVNKCEYEIRTRVS